MSNVYQDYKVPQVGGLYHKFEDGISYQLRLLTEPAVYESTYTNQDGEDVVSTKYAWVAYFIDEKGTKILSLPTTAYKQIAALASDEDYGDPRMYNLKIKRTGTGPSTVYTITPSPKKSDWKELDKDIENALEQLDLLEIVKKGRGVAHVNWLANVVAVGSKHVVETKPEKTEDVVIEDIDDKPIDLSTIPF